MTNKTAKLIYFGNHKSNLSKIVEPKQSLPIYQTYSDYKGLMVSFFENFDEGIFVDEVLKQNQNRNFMIKTENQALENYTVTKETSLEGNEIISVRKSVGEDSNLIVYNLLENFDIALNFKSLNLKYDINRLSMMNLSIPGFFEDNFKILIELEHISKDLDFSIKRSGSFHEKNAIEYSLVDHMKKYHLYIYSTEKCDPITEYVFFIEFNHFF